jgi:hypothetical protein
VKRARPLDGTMPVMHRLEATLLVLLDLGHAMGPHPGDGLVKLPPRGLGAKPSGQSCEHRHPRLRSPPLGSMRGRRPAFPDPVQNKNRWRAVAPGKTPKSQFWRI